MTEPDSAADTELWERARVPGAPQRGELADRAADLGRSELLRRGAAPADLDDLTQEVVRSTLAFVSRGGEAPKDLGAFLKYRAWGVLSDHRKRLRARPTMLELEPELDQAAPSAAPEARAEREQTLAALHDCRSRLTDEQRATIELRYLAGLDGDSIAAQLGVHRNTVHVRVHRALLALRECLERKGLFAEDLEP